MHRRRVWAADARRSWDHCRVAWGFYTWFRIHMPDGLNKPQTLQAGDLSGNTVETELCLGLLVQASCLQAIENHDRT